MTPPKLIGLVSLRLPKILVPGEELGRTIAFDDAGRGWLLVERLTRLGDKTTGKGAKSSYGRVDYVRWQALAPLRFEETNPVEFFTDGDPPADGSDPSDPQ